MGKEGIKRNRFSLLRSLAFYCSRERDEIVEPLTLFDYRPKRIQTERPNLWKSLPLT